jgi:hypothetical protein
MDKVWEPHKIQAEFLELPDTIFEALYGGAAGGGKSEALYMLPLVRGFHKLPRFKGIIFRRTYPELEAEIILRSYEWYSDSGGTYNSEKRRWTWPSGAIMQFGHCEHEQDIRKYDSAEYNYAAFDELTSFTEFQYTYFFSRVRTSIAGLPTIIRSGTNPGNVGHAWVRRRFVEPGPSNIIYRDVRTGLLKIFIPCLPTDNPFIDPGYYQRLQAMPEAERRAKANGDWWTFEGQVFDEWRDIHRDNEPAHACHVIDDFPIPEWWPKILAVDWGFSAMTYGLWGAINPQRKLILYREYSDKKRKISEWAEAIKERCTEPIDAGIMCKSAWQNRGEELLLVDQASKIIGVKFERPDNNRMAGKLAIQERMRWKPRAAEKPPPEGFDIARAAEILRKKGVVAYESYKRVFEPPVPEDLPKMLVCRSLDVLRKTIPLCVYDKKNTKTEKPSEDVAEFDGDDPYDTLRYIVLRADSFEIQSIKRAAEVQKVGQIYADLERTGDQTTFYRRMERLHLPSAKPIPRFSRRRRYH